LLELNFELVGTNVIDETGKKFGKVIDYIIDTNSFFIQQLKVKQKMIKSLSKTKLLIHRTQIIEISNTTITVKSSTNKIKLEDTPSKLSFINPFKSTSPQADSRDS
jgi:sporulation protein YlmC with PRC-barrel domain